MNLPGRARKSSSRDVGGQTKRSSLNYYRARQASPTVRSAGNTRSIAKKVERAIIYVTSRLSLAILAIAFLFFVIGSNSTPRVIAGSTQYRPLSAYQSFVNAHVNKLKDSTKFSFDSNSITSGILSEFPEVNSATVELPLLGRTPVVRLNIAKPVFQLSGGQEQDFYVSAAGKVVNKSTSIQNLPIIKDASGVILNTGDQLLSESQVRLLSDIAGQMAKSKLAIKYILLPAKAEEADMYLKDQSYYVKLNLNGDAAGEAGELLAVNHYLVSHHVTPRQYVDVRVQGKVFYK